MGITKQKPSNGKKKIKVVIADDHELFREGLRNLLEAEKDMKIVGEAENGKEAVEITLSKKPHIVLMDIRMPEMNGIDATKKIKIKNPDINVLMLTVFEDEVHIFNAIQAGASGYFLKSHPIKELISQIRSICGGEVSLSSKVAAGLVKELQKRNLDTSKEYNLTEREIDVLKLVILGNTNKEISKTLYLAIQTVKNHLTDMYRKFEVENRTQLVIKAVEGGIIDTMQPTEKM